MREGTKGTGAKDTANAAFRLAEQPLRLQGTLEEQLRQLRQENAELMEKDAAISAELERKRVSLEALKKLHEEQFVKLQAVRKDEIQKLKAEQSEALRERWEKAEHEAANNRTAVDNAVMELKSQNAAALRKAQERAQAALAEVDKLREEVNRERETQKKIREDCDDRVTVCRQEMAREVMRVRKEAAADAEAVLIESRRLVDAASGRVDEQRRRVKASSRETIANAETSIAMREAEMGASAREACEEYWRQAALSNQQVEAETRALQKLCNELENTTRSQRDDLQVRARQEAEEQIDVHRRRKRAILLQLEAQQWQHDAAVTEVMQKAEEECRKFENACRRRASLQISAHKRAAQRAAGRKSEIPTLLQAQKLKKSQSGSSLLQSAESPI